MSDVNFKVSIPGPSWIRFVLGEFHTYAEAFVMWQQVAKKNPAAVIQDVKAAS